MSVKSIEIKNLFSYEYMKIDGVQDINCIVGKNNVGKSNILKALRFFYGKLEGKRELAPELNSNYTSHGSITIEFDTERLHQIVKSDRNQKVAYFRRINNLLFKDFFKNKEKKKLSFSEILKNKEKKKRSVKRYPLTLYISNDGMCEWSIKDKNAVKLLGVIFPFFEVDARHMNLHEWDKIWHVTSSLKSIDFGKISTEDVSSFFNEKLGDNNNSYSSLISLVEDAVTTKSFTYKERILNYIKLGLKGDKFIINGENLDFQSDGTNAYNFVNTLLTLLIALTRSEYISPFIFLDEPELGLHPKLNEQLIDNLSENFAKYSLTKHGKKAKTGMPSIFISTHSPNIVKEVIKKFQTNHQILHLSKKTKENTKIVKLHSTYAKNNFLSTFSDNEARLFFSDFILFVEGQTELEAFGNKALRKHFKHLDGVDFYCSSSNTSSESINPSSTNAAIPYLFLFDADKAYKFHDRNQNAVSVVLEKNGKLFDLHRNSLNRDLSYYKKGFSKEYKRLHDNIVRIIKFSQDDHLVDRESARFLNAELYSEFHDNVEQYLLTKRVKLIPNTFEGCLISVQSADLFYSWLKDEKNTNLTLFVKRAKKNKNEQRLIEFLRVLFNGKSETLKQAKHFTSKSKTISGWSVRYFNQLKLELRNITGRKKTDGWVTQFINYSIDKIEHESQAKNIEFEYLFDSYFPEFYDIIKLLQSDR